MKKILIIGGSGFIGKNLREYLSENDNYIISAPSSEELNVVNEEEVKKYIKNNYFDVIIHSAIHNPGNNLTRKSENLLEYSLRMYYNFEKMQDYYGKMLYLGSGAEYWKHYNMKNVKEDEIGRVIPKYDYGFAKYIINNSIRNSRNIYNLRLFGIYGKYENWKTKFISNLCCKAIKGVPLTIRQNVYFDYLYINDFCRIVNWFIENHPKYKDYNIVTGKRVDLILLAKKVRDISKKNLPIYVCKEGFANEYTASNERMINEMNDFKYTNLDEAINELYNWYKNNEDIIDMYSLLYQ